jgi:hypothetical protein
MEERLLVTSWWERYIVLVTMMEERLLEMTGGGVFCRRRYEGAAAREASSDDDVGGVPSSQCRRLTRIGGYRLVTTWRREPQVATMEERMLETMDGAVSSEDDLANGDEEWRRGMRRVVLGLADELAVGEAPGEELTMADGAMRSQKSLECR